MASKAKAKSKTRANARCCEVESGGERIEAERRLEVEKKMEERRRSEAESASRALKLVVKADRTLPRLRSPRLRFPTVHRIPASIPFTFRGRETSLSLALSLYLSFPLPIYLYEPHGDTSSTYPSWDIQGGLCNLVL